MEIEFFFDSMENYFDASFMASKRKVNLTPITSSEFIIFLNIMVIEFFVDSMEDSFDTSFMASKREVHLTPITLIDPSFAINTGYRLQFNFLGVTLFTVLTQNLGGLYRLACCFRG